MHFPRCAPERSVPERTYILDLNKHEIGACAAQSNSLIFYAQKCLSRLGSVVKMYVVPVSLFFSLPSFGRWPIDVRVPHVVHGNLGTKGYLWPGQRRRLPRRRGGGGGGGRRYHHWGLVKGVGFLPVRGPFSAVSTPIFPARGSSCSTVQSLQDYLYIIPHCAMFQEFCAFCFAIVSAISSIS